MNVAVVTDSAASLPNGAPESLGIVTVPLTLVLGGLVYADGDLDPGELMVRSTHDSVSTSSPSPGEFLKALATATEREETKDVIRVGIADADIPGPPVEMWLGGQPIQARTEGERRADRDDNGDDTSGTSSWLYAPT
jgi:hypothetical protein